LSTAAACFSDAALSFSSAWLLSMAACA